MNLGYELRREYTQFGNSYLRFMQQLTPEMIKLLHPTTVQKSMLEWLTANSQNNGYYKKILENEDRITLQYQLKSCSRENTTNLLIVWHEEKKYPLYGALHGKYNNKPSLGFKFLFTPEKIINSQQWDTYTSVRQKDSVVLPDATQRMVIDQSAKNTSDPDHEHNLLSSIDNGDHLRIETICRTEVVFSKIIDDYVHLGTFEHDRKKVVLYAHNVDRQQTRKE